ncbi:MAG: PAS domain-containing sensor histidine kinase [Bacteroidota bacterium]|nr:PAS domain-containing sensor histidine kinase [Bacteroidota bacterium]
MIETTGRFKINIAQYNHFGKALRSMEKGKYQSPEVDLSGRKTEEELQRNHGVKTTSGDAVAEDNLNRPETQNLLYELELLRSELKMKSEELLILKARCLDLEKKNLYPEVESKANKHEEEFMKMDEEKFRRLIENSFDMFVLIDSHGIQHFVSDSCEKILGFRPDELINIPVIERMIHPDDREKIIETFQNAALIGYGRAQYRHRHKNGGWVYLEAYGTNQINNPGINSIVLNVRDITERKLAEEELKEREEIFRLFLENSPIYIFFKDENIRSLRLSRNYENLIGKSMNELIGKTMDELFPSDLAKSMVENDLDILKNGVKIEIEEEFNGHYYSTIKFPIQIEGKPTYLAGFTIDITERKHAEMALRDSEARLRELNATKDKFFSIIAHDLKNPFNSIVGFSDLLTRKIQERDYEGIAGYSRMIGNSSQRAMDLLTNLLKWACIQTGRIDFIPECIDMVELTSDVIKLLSILARQKSIAITTHFPPLVFVMADKEMISTVLRNLISNAVKFTNPGGEIVISAKPKQKEWVITIADNGVGIKKEAINKLFRIDQSYSTMGTQNEKGTGLGLLLCKEFIEKHNGRIWIESEEGQGSKFHFSVPKG